MAAKRKFNIHGFYFRNLRCEILERENRKHSITSLIILEVGLDKFAESVFQLFRVLSYDIKYDCDRRTLYN